MNLDTAMSNPLLKDSPPCSCSTCKGMCVRPCWPIPSEILPLIESGYTSSLMLDWWEGDFHDGEHDRVYIVCPSSPGREGNYAPDFLGLQSGCIFLTQKGLCRLHPLGLKPTEGRVAHHSIGGDNGYNIHRAVAETWDTEQGRDIVNAWCEKVGISNPYYED